MPSMTPEALQAQFAELNARLKVMGIILRLGHDLFAAPDFESAATAAVNSARPIINFKSSTLLGVERKQGLILSQFAQVKVNAHAPWAQAQCELVQNLEFGKDDCLTLNAEFLQKNEVGDDLKKILTEMFKTTPQMLAVKLKAPAFLTNVDMVMIWLLEFDEEIPPFAVTSVRLLAGSYAEALYCQKFARVAVTNKLRRWKPVYVFLAVVLILVGLMAVIPIPESTNAEFVLRPPDVTAVYAWFDGPIAKCHVQDGSSVKKGDLIAEYDVSNIRYRLEAAMSSKKEIVAERELLKRNVNDRDSQSKIRLLNARIEAAEVTVKEARWYLEHAKLTAPQDGILVLSDGRAEMLTGKAVRTGDKLFDIYGGEGMNAEIQVNERESSILLSKPEQVVLFLHTAPETPLHAEVEEIGEYPVLTEQRMYCYTLRAKLDEQSQKEDIRYGMRGIAKISGQKVSILYFLFKSVILYMRGI